MIDNSQFINRLLGRAAIALKAENYQLASQIAAEILQRDSNHAGASAIRFDSLFKSKQFDQARAIGQHAAELNPSSEFILNNQACLQIDAMQAAPAIDHLNSLIQQFGERPAWLYNLGLANRMSQNSEQSILAFRRTLDLKPDHDKAAFQLVECLTEAGRGEEAVLAQNYLRLLRPKHSTTHSRFIELAVGNAQLSKQELKQELGLWAGRFIPKGNNYPVEPIKNLKQVVIGFLIGDIPLSLLSATVAPVINHLSEGKDQIVVYSVEREHSLRLFNSAIKQIPTADLSDADFARQVRRDRIEILVDIAGLRQGERQRALGLQLASKQFGWLAHEGQYASKLVRVIDEELGQTPFFIDLSKPLDTPIKDIHPENSLVAVGCNTGLATAVVSTWAELLKRLKDSHLHLDVEQPTIARTIEQQFADLGVAADRLSFSNEYRLSAGSVVLDNFLKNDIVAVAKALKAGASVIALSGSLFPAQQTAKLLEQVERDEWVCKDRINYIGKVLRLVREQRTKPITKGEFSRSNLEDLKWFVRQFRKTLLM